MSLQQEIALGKLFGTKSNREPSVMETIGSLIPHHRVRERYFTWLQRDPSNLPAQKVEDFYRQVETSFGRTSSESTLAAIRYHREFRQTIITTDDLPYIQWYFEHDNPNHISHHLTTQGTNRSIWEVVNKYLQGTFRDQHVIPWKEDDMLAILERYRQGDQLPELILSTRPWGNIPDGKIHIIDGVHRILALALYALESSKSVQHKAFIT